jgi:hypothetical protein
MAKTPAATLISDLAKRLDLDSTDSTNVRPDLLRQLNISQTTILQDRSLRFLVTGGLLVLHTATAAVVVPTTLDDGKAMSLGRPDGNGRLEYVPPDEWHSVGLDVLNMPPLTAPNRYTVAIAGGVLTFLFLPPNSTGGDLNIPYLAQLIPVAMTDASNSYSMFPEGWEDSLLLDHAEGELRRFLGKPFWQELASRADDKAERLYASYRTTKEKTVVDREQKERKVAREQLAPEKP